jgi:hypothetical protein
VCRAGRDLVYRPVGQQLLLAVDGHLEVHVGAGAARRTAGVADLGQSGAGVQHHLLDGLAQLLLAAAVPGGQLAHRAIHVGLAPELGAAVLKQVEVVRIVAFLLDDLELDVLIVEAGLWLGGASVPYS